MACYSVVVTTAKSQQSLNFTVQPFKGSFFTLTLNAWVRQTSEVSAEKSNVANRKGITTVEQLQQ